MKKSENLLLKGIGFYINLTFNALRTRMCKRLSLLAINSYLSWCGKRKRRQLPSKFIFLYFLYFSVFLENVCKTVDLRKDKIMLCKTIKWHYLWPPTPRPLPPTYPLTALAKWCVSIYNCCQGLRLKSLFMNPTNGLALAGP